MNKLLVVGAGEFQLPGLVEAKELGYYVIATDGDQQAPGKDIADEFYHVDIKDGERHLAIAQKHAIGGVVAFAAEAAVETVALVSDRLHLIGNPYEVAILSHDKKQYYNCLLQAGIRIPSTLSYADFLNSDCMPEYVIVKPSKGSGSRLVAKLRTPDVESYVQKQRAALNNDEEFLVQAYIKGKEITVDGFVYNNEVFILAISEEKSQPDASVSYELVFPPEWLDEKFKDLVITTTQNIAKRLQITFGPIHMEYLLDAADNLFLIDFSLRGGGFKVFTDIVKKTSGEHVLRKYILSAMGQGINLKQPRDFKPVILKFLYACRDGKIVSITGSEAGTFEDHMFFYLKDPGDQVSMPFAGKDRLAYMICWGEDLVKVRKQVDYLSQRFKVALEE